MTQARRQALPGVSWGSHWGGELATRGSGAAASGGRGPSLSPSPPLSRCHTLNTQAFWGGHLDSVLPPHGFCCTEEPGAGHQVALSGTDAGRSVGMLRLYLTFLGSAQVPGRPGAGQEMASGLRGPAGARPRPCPRWRWAPGPSRGLWLSTSASCPVWVPLDPTPWAGWGRPRKKVLWAQKTGSPLQIL